MPLDNAKMTKSARHQMPKNRDKMLYADAQDAGHIMYLDARVRTPYVKRAPGRLNLQCTVRMIVWSLLF